MSEEENIEDQPKDNGPRLTENNNISEPSIINELTSTEEMEVHKHPHHITHKKKWGEYLLEFFMLFLAVFLGFVAENIREKQVDKAREKEYMISMLSDLSNDTLSANITISTNRLYISGEDTTLHFLAGNLQNQDTAEMALVSFYRYSIYSNSIRITDGTISQLKNNGGMRLLRSKDVINKINSYYNEIVILKLTEAAINDFLSTIDKQAGGIFNYSANKNFIDASNSSETDVYKIPLPQLKGWLTHGSPTMLATDIKALSTFMSTISYHIGLMHSYIVQLKNQKKEAIELMQLIKKSYHLENE